MLCVFRILALDFDHERMQVFDEQRDSQLFTIRDWVEFIQGKIKF